MRIIDKGCFVLQTTSLAFVSLLAFAHVYLLQKCIIISCGELPGSVSHLEEVFVFFLRVNGSKT